MSEDGKLFFGFLIVIAIIVVAITIGGAFSDKGLKEENSRLRQENKELREENAKLIKSYQESLDKFKKLLKEKDKPGE